MLNGIIGKKTVCIVTGYTDMRRGIDSAVIRHIALNLYKSFTKVKLSMKAKRFRCSFDDQFLCNVILNKFC